MIIDTPWSTLKYKEELIKNNVTTVLRYYNHRNSQRLPEKRLTRQEAVALSEINISIAVVFQQRQDRIADFSYEQGVRSGRRACNIAIEQIGQPFGSAIYTAVDYDAHKESELSQILKYFEGFKAGIEGDKGYKVGGYGGGKLLFRLLAEELVSYTWLSLSKGWAGYKEFLESNLWNLSQYAQSTYEGLEVELNRVNRVQGPVFGQFRLSNNAKPVTGQHTSKLHRKLGRV